MITILVLKNFFGRRGFNVLSCLRLTDPLLVDDATKTLAGLRDLFCMQALRPRHATRVDGKMLNMYEWPWLHCIFGPNEKKLFVFFQVLIDSQYHDKIK